MRKTILMIAVASASVLTMAACTSSGWGQRGSQQSGSTHTLTGGAEAAPTSEATPKPAGPSGSGTQQGAPAGSSGGGNHGGHSGGSSGGGSTGGSKGDSSDGSSGDGRMQPEQPVAPQENMGSRLR